MKPKKTPSWYRKRNNAIVKEYEKGAGMDELAEKYGISEQRIYGIVSKGSRKYREKVDRKASDVRKEREKIYWLYRRGYKAREIAERYGLKVTRVSSVNYQMRWADNMKADWKSSLVPVEIIDRKTGKVVARYPSVSDAGRGMYISLNTIAKALKAYPEPIGGWFGDRYLARKAEANAGKLYLLSEEEIDRMMEEERRKKER